MSEIFKVNYIISNKINKIYVFKGNKTVENIDISPSVNGKNIFTDGEWESIKKDSTEIIYINKYIHKDDTIIRIKEKILKECNGLNSSTKEMYLFSLKKTKIEPIIYHNKLTQNENLELTEVRLKQFLWNFIEDENNLNNKTTFFSNINIKRKSYNYEDSLN